VVAVKMFEGVRLDEAEEHTIRELRKEAEMLENLSNHPCIVKFVGAITQGTYPRVPTCISSSLTSACDVRCVRCVRVDSKRRSHHVCAGYGVLLPRLAPRSPGIEVLSQMLTTRIHRTHTCTHRTHALTARTIAQIRKNKKLPLITLVRMARDVATGILHLHKVPPFLFSELILATKLTHPHTHTHTSTAHTAHNRST
jgi:hypothetical protein